ncbi:MAG: type II toxin-antitoxin system RelE/ParE family toxin [Candidatus Methylomirabilis sp.]|nr:type II toxin-antitoxin system RelE/ParE family toxin [Deltaproteobacteria bacterium]
MSDAVRVLVLKTFERAAKKLFGAAEVEALSTYLAANPEAGAVIPGACGARKARWRLAGRGKRGGARVVYYYNGRTALYLIVAYAKNEREDLSPEGKARVAELVDEIKRLERS